MSDYQYGRVPTKPIATGVLNNIKNKVARGVYIVICAHSNRDLETTIGQRKIARLTGHPLGSVNRAIKELESAGAIEKLYAKNGSAKVIRISKTVLIGANGETEQPFTKTQANRSHLEAQPFTKKRKTVLMGANETEQHIKQQEHNNIAAAGGAGGGGADFSDIEQVLHSAGIWPSEVSKLAKQAGKTGKDAIAVSLLVLDAKAKAKDKNKPAPLLAKMIDDGETAHPTPGRICEAIKAGYLTKLDGISLEGKSITHNSNGVYCYIDGKKTCVWAPAESSGRNSAITRRSVDKPKQDIKTANDSERKAGLAMMAQALPKYNPAQSSADSQT